MEEKKNSLNCDTWAELQYLQHRILLLASASYHVADGGGGTPAAEFESESEFADAVYAELMSIHKALKDVVENLRGCCE